MSAIMSNEKRISNNWKKANAVIGTFGIESFTDISVTVHTVLFFAKFSKDMVIELDKNKFRNAETTGQGFVGFERHGVKIYLS